MTIDFKKLIIQLLTLNLRRIKLASFIYVLIDEISKLYSRQLFYIKDRRIKLACTPQTVWLEKIVHYITGVEIVITEHDHKPYDFFVKIISRSSSNDLNNKVVSIIDQYKLAGKSYTFETSILSINYEFSEWVCTKVFAPPTYTFNKWICEKYETQRKGISIHIQGFGDENTIRHYNIKVTSILLDESIKVQIRTIKGLGLDFNLSPDIPSTEYQYLGSHKELGDFPIKQEKIFILREGSDVTAFYQISIL